MTDFDQNKANEKIEFARERGDHPAALAAAEELIIDRIKADDFTAVINAIGHKLLIYKDLWHATKKPEFNELMLHEINYGMHLTERHSITGQPKAILLHRSSDYYFEKADYAMAAKLSGLACDELPQKDTGQYAELLNHHTAAQVLSGNSKEFYNFDIAYQIAEQDNNLRDFHKLAILTGVLLRKIFVLIKQGKTAEAEVEIHKAEPMCEELAEKHYMPVRKNQLDQLKTQRAAM